MAPPQALPKPDMTGISPAWIRGIPISTTDPNWNAYDATIQQTVTTYNAWLKGQHGFSDLDWLLVKAMCWTETGANAPEWKTRPAQIGNPGDTGLDELLSGKPQSNLILPSTFPPGTLALTADNVRKDPATNIRAAVGYLLLRSATFAYVSVPSQNVTQYVHKVTKGDTFERIASDEGTTVRELTADNPDPHHKGLSIGHDVFFRKASNQWIIKDMVTVDTKQAAKTYNNADVDGYVKKVNYCLWIFKGGKP